MSVCGERYKYLAVTISGYNFDNPHGLYVFPFADYLEWKAVAEKVVGLVNKHLASLQAVELVKNPATPEFLKLTAERTLLVKHFEDLPAIISFSTDSQYEWIDAAMAVVSEALCLLEQTDVAIESYGEKAPEVPGLGPKPEDKPRLPKLPEIPDPKDIPWWVWVIGGTATLAIAGGLYQRTRGPSRGPVR